LRYIRIHRDVVARTTQAMIRTPIFVSRKTRRERRSYASGGSEKVTLVMASCQRRGKGEETEFQHPHYSPQFNPAHYFDPTYSSSTESHLIPSLPTNRQCNNNNCAEDYSTIAKLGRHSVLAVYDERQYPYLDTEMRLEEKHDKTLAVKKHHPPFLEYHPPT
jgi:hypothetical protein